jgi:hypothetical protein
MPHGRGPTPLAPWFLVAMSTAGPDHPRDRGHGGDAGFEEKPANAPVWTSICGDDSHGGSVVHHHDMTKRALSRGRVWYGYGDLHGALARSSSAVCRRRAAAAEPSLIQWSVLGSWLLCLHCCMIAPPGIYNIFFSPSGVQPVFLPAYSDQGRQGTWMDEASKATIPGFNGDDSWVGRTRRRITLAQPTLVEGVQRPKHTTGTRSLPDLIAHMPPCFRSRIESAKCSMPSRHKGQKETQKNSCGLQKHSQGHTHTRSTGQPNP